ncbi:hypothetical protein LINGRAPRIM_LOCUS580 [Linum grandiflorum]
MASNWGVSADTPVSELGDDSWLLECASEAEAKRIIGLDRVLFGSAKIFLDSWFPCAGRTKVLKQQGLEWILVRGIPLHLLSSALFKQIGNACGGFVDACSSGCLFGSVRIKVKKSRVIPTELTLDFLKEKFVVSVSVEEGLDKDPGEALRPVEDVRSRDISAAVAKHKGTLVPGTPRRWNLERGQSSMASERFENGEGCASRRCDNEFPPVITEAAAPWTATPVSARVSLSAAGKNPEDIRELARFPKEAGVSSTVLQLGEQVRDSEAEVGQGGLCHRKFHPGLHLNEKLDIMVGSSFFTLAEEKKLNGLLMVLGLGKSRVEFLNGPWTWSQRGFGPINVNYVDVGLDAGRICQGVQIFDSPDLDLAHVSTSICERSFISQCPEVELAAIELPSSEFECFAERSLVEEEDGLLMEAVGRVSSLVGLKFEGSTDLALQRVSLSATEVAERRKSAKGRSRLELELRRLGASMEDFPSCSSRRRVSGYVSAIPFLNDA